MQQKKKVYDFYAIFVVIYVYIQLYTQSTDNAAECR